MSRLSTQDFVGNRARMQRLRDAKIFNAWVSDFFGNTVSIQIGTTAFMEIGDEFRMEVYGENLMLTFHAQLEEVEVVDTLGTGGGTAIEGSNARMIEAHTVEMLLNISTQVKFTHSSESARYKLEGQHVGIRVGGRPCNAILIDVSKNGMGVSCECEIEPNTEVELSIPTHLGDVRATATVKYCREDREKAGYFRLGLMFADMSRLDRPRWTRFLQELY